MCLFQENKSREQLSIPIDKSNKKNSQAFYMTEELLLGTLLVQYSMLQTFEANKPL